MRKQLLTSSLLLAVLPPAAAGLLTPDQALQAALGKHPMHRLAPSSADMYRFATASETNLCYAFNRASGEGFTIVSAVEGSKHPVLAYSDSGRIDPNNMPDGLRWFMETVGETTVVSNAPARDLEDIEPLIKTKWSQEPPYNAYCPVQNDKVTYVGCVATAISQILQHPSNRIQPTGSRTYTWPSMQGVELTFDYDARPFQYDKILDDYTGGYTDEQAEAVANLCFGVGVACNMDYGWMQSGCNQYEAADALTKHLGVDNGMGLLLRDFYEAHEWAATIHKRLAEDCPVMYIGVSTSGAHAFIADGYAGEEGDFFHINWGWGGMSDGYFLLSALLPDKLGVGGGSDHDGFNSNQMAYVDIRPAKEGSKPAPTIYVTGQICAEFIDGSTSAFSVSFDHGLGYNPGIFSFALEDVTGAVCFKLTDTITGEETIIGRTEDLLFEPYGGYVGFTTGDLELPDNGEYILTLGFMRDEKVYEVVHDITTRNEVRMICDNGARRFESVDVGHRVVCENLYFASDEIVRTKPFNFKVDLRAQHVDFDTSVFPVLLNDEGEVAATMSHKLVKLNDGESVTLEWNEQFKPVLSEKTYRFTILDEDYNLLCEMKEINVVKRSGVEDLTDEESDEDSAVYYKLDGTRIQGPQPGTVTIRRTAKGSKKTM